MSTPTRKDVKAIQPLALVDAKDGPRIDSRVFAESMGNTHRPTVALIDKYLEPLERFAQVLFKKAVGERKQGGSKGEGWVKNGSAPEKRPKLGRVKSKLGKVPKSKLGDDSESLPREGFQALLVEALWIQKKERESLYKIAPKEERFVAEYLIYPNAEQAAIRSGYSAKSAEQQGHQNLKKTSVRAAIVMPTAVNHVAALAMARATDHHQGYARAKAALGTLQGLLAPPDKGPAACLHLASGRADHGL